MAAADSFNLMPPIAKGWSGREIARGSFDAPAAVHRWRVAFGFPHKLWIGMLPPTLALNLLRLQASHNCV